MAAQKRRRRPVKETSVDTEPSLQWRMNATIEQLKGVFAERENALMCMAIAMLTGMNYLLVGPRGTAKTALANCFMKHVEGARHFSTLLGSFTTMSDLVGRIDLAKLQQGIEERRTEGKALAVDTAFFDEALKGSDGVLNSMLGLLSENRDFEGKPTDLWCVGSATNWPEVDRRTDRIAALYDRFQLKVPVTTVQSREARVKVLRSSRALADYTPADGVTMTMDEIREASKEVAKVSIGEDIEDLLCSVQERCLKEGIEVSDRKLGQWQRALQAYAWLDGREEVGIKDFEILTYMAWDDSKEIDKALAIMNSCDRELVQALIRKVDEARNAYAKARNEGLDAEKAGKVLDTIIETAESVNESMKRYELKNESRRDVARAVQNLSKDFQALHAKFKHVLDAEEA